MKFLRSSPRRKDESGFSFIEAIITVAVLGILSSIAIPGYGAIQTNAKQATVDASARTGYALAVTYLTNSKLAAPTTVGQTFNSAREVLDSLEDATIKLNFLDYAGEVITDPAENVCVQAYNPVEKAAKGFKFTSTYGDCERKAVTPPGEEEEAPPVVTPPPPVQNIPVLTPLTGKPEARDSYRYQDARLFGYSNTTRYFRVDNVAATSNNKDGKVWISGPSSATRSSVSYYTSDSNVGRPTIVGSSPAGVTFHTLAVADDGTLYAAGSNGIIYRHVSNSNWTPLTTAGNPIHKMVLNEKGDILFTRGSAVEEYAMSTGATRTLFTDSGIVDFVITGTEVVFTRATGANAGVYKATPEGSSYKVEALASTPIFGLTATKSGDVYGVDHAAVVSSVNPKAPGVKTHGQAVRSMPVFFYRGFTMSDTGRVFVPFQGGTNGNVNLMLMVSQI